MIKVNVNTTAIVTADVTTTIDNKLNISKTFNGLREEISMVVRTSTLEQLTAIAEVNFKSGKETTTFYLGEPAPSPRGDIKEVGATSLSGSVTLTAEEAKQGLAFPSLNISGTFLDVQMRGLLLLCQIFCPGSLTY